MGRLEDRYKPRSVEHSFFTDQPLLKEEHGTVNLGRIRRYAYHADADGNLVREILTKIED